MNERNDTQSGARARERSVDGSEERKRLIALGVIRPAGAEVETTATKDADTPTLRIDDAGTRDARREIAERQLSRKTRRSAR